MSRWFLLRSSPASCFVSMQKWESGRKRRTVWPGMGNHAEYDANELPVGENNGGASIFR